MITKHKAVLKDFPTYTFKPFTIEDFEVSKWRIKGKEYTSTSSAPYAACTIKLKDGLLHELMDGITNGEAYVCKTAKCEWRGVSRNKEIRQSIMDKRARDLRRIVKRLAKDLINAKITRINNLIQEKVDRVNRTSHEEHVDLFTSPFRRISENWIKENIYDSDDEQAEMAEIQKQIDLLYEKSNSIQKKIEEKVCTGLAEYVENDKKCQKRMTPELKTEITQKLRAGDIQREVKFKRFR